jgi:hypothetical protein
MVVNSVVDRRRFDADPDPTFHFDAIPDSDPDPTTSYTHVGNHIFAFYSRQSSLHCFFLSRQQHRYQ